MAKTSSVRKGYTKLHREKKEVRDAIIAWHNSGYTLSAIRTLLERDYGKKASERTISAFISDYNDTVGSHVASSDEFKERVLNEFANVLSGLNLVQDELRIKFQDALASDDMDAISTYAKLINDNVLTAHKVMGDFMKDNKLDKKPVEKSFGQFLEKIEIDTKSIDTYKGDKSV